MRFLLRPLLLTSTLLGSVLGAAPAAQAAITYIGEAAIAGNLTDLSNLNFNLEDGLPANRLGAFGSGIAYNPITGTYFTAPDRGPNAVPYAGGAAVDNTVSYQARIDEFRLTVNLGAGSGGSGGSVGATLLSTRLLTTETGTPLTGLSSNFANRFDPEAVRIGRDGRVYISDEYGPAVYEFDPATGQRTRSFTLPNGFTATTPGPTTASELPPANTAGRQPNRGAP